MQGWLWIAQIETDSPTEIIGDFLKQLPLGPVLFVCLSGLLLTVAMAWFAYFKPQRNRRRERQATTQPSFSATPAYDFVSDVDEMPDMDMLLGGSGKRTATEKPASTPAQALPEASAPMRQGGRVYRVQLKGGAIIRAEEQLAILRDPRDGRLLVQIDKEAYRSLVGEPEAKNRFLTLMRELNDVINKVDDHPPEAPEEKEELADIEPDAPGVLPSFKLEDNVRVTSKGYESAPVPELNIAQAIEQYLQYKLRRADDYAGRQIHVLPAPGGGVRIQVDHRYFEAVDDVDDVDVRVFLRQAIQEWQKRQA